MKTKVMQERIHLARLVNLVESEGVVARAELNRFTNTWIRHPLNEILTADIEIVKMTRCTTR